MLKQLLRRAWNVPPFVWNVVLWLTDAVVLTLVIRDERMSLLQFMTLTAHGVDFDIGFLWYFAILIIMAMLACLSRRAFSQHAVFDISAFAWFLAINANIRDSIYHRMLTLALIMLFFIQSEASLVVLAAKAIKSKKDGRI